MSFSHSIKNIQEIIDSKKNQITQINLIIQNKGTQFQKDFSAKIKEIETSIKLLKQELKNINIEAKQIAKVLNEGKDILVLNDFSDYLSISSIKNFKDLSYNMALEKPVVDWKTIISKKIQSKYLPLELWTDEKIQEVLSDTLNFPTSKDIYSKLPKSYKPKNIPKKREDVIRNIINHVNKVRSGYIIDKV